MDIWIYIKVVSESVLLSQSFSCSEDSEDYYCNAENQSYLLTVVNNSEVNSGTLYDMRTSGTLCLPNIDFSFWKTCANGVCVGKAKSI